jgi:hypothetical protein
MVLRAVVMPPATFKVLSGLEAARRAPPRQASLTILTPRIGLIQWQGLVRLEFGDCVVLAVFGVI